MRLRTILETVLYVDDLDRAARFYGGVLGLDQVSHKPGVFVFFRLDQQMLLLFEPTGAEKARGVPAHGARRPWDMPASPSASGELEVLGHRVGACRHCHRAVAGSARRRSLPLLSYPAGSSAVITAPRI